MKKIAHLILGLLFLSFLGCSPGDDSDSQTNNPPQDFATSLGTSTTRDFIGLVVDTNDQPVAAATVKIGTTSVQTDENGVFLINGAAVYEKFAYITAKKNGYVDGSRAMVPTAGKNNVKIMLLSNAATHTITAGASSEVAIASGTKIVFDGAFEDASGNAYSGNVSVSMFHLTPSNQNLDALMPGSLFAQGIDGGAKVLQTFGMLHAELKGSAGQKLQIAAGHTAQITMTIDPSQMAVAPATIPLWHFDEVNGYWKQEGSATKTANKYVGNVSHFSWWNCDTFTSTVNLTVKVTDSDGNPISGALVKLKLTDTGMPGSSTTDSNGQASGRVPTNRPMTLSVSIENICTFVYEELYTDQIGPFTADTALPPIVLDVGSSLPQLQQATVSGLATHCDLPVQNGYMMLKYNNRIFTTSINNGNFSFTMMSCNVITTSNTFTLQGFDSDEQASIGIRQCTFSPPNTFVGTINTCPAPPLVSSPDEFISYKIDNNAEYKFLPPQNPQFGYTAYSSPTNFAISYFSSPSVQFNLTTVTATGFFSPIQGIGNYTSLNAKLNLRINGNYTVNNTYTENTITYHVTSLPAIGQFIDATFNGTYVASDGFTHNIQGVIHVLRDQ